MRSGLLLSGVVMLTLGCATPLEEIQPDVVAAAKLANAQAEELYGSSPFFPEDFVAAEREEDVSLIALAPYGLGELMAEVVFTRDRPPTVSLKIITSYDYGSRRIEYKVIE